jgi:hypothetical protein
MCIEEGGGMRVQLVVESTECLNIFSPSNVFILGGHLQPRYMSIASRQIGKDEMRNSEHISLKPQIFSRGKVVLHIISLETYRH